MGEARNQPFQLSFNPALRVEFQGSRVTSDGGLILVRELDERLGFSDLIAQHVTDPRGKNTQFPARRLGPAIGLPPLGGVRGRQRRRAPLPRSDVPADRVGDDLGARGRSDVPSALVRDGVVWCSFP